MNRIVFSLLALLAASTAAFACQVVLAPPPSNTVLPIISGTAQVGLVATAVKGTWTGATTITDQWIYLDTGAAIAGATSLTYTFVAADVGHTIALKESGTNTIGTTTVTSACL